MTFNNDFILNDHHLVVEVDQTIVIGLNFIKCMRLQNYYKANINQMQVATFRQLMNVLL